MVSSIRQQYSQHQSPGPSANRYLAPWCFRKLYRGRFSWATIFAEAARSQMGLRTIRVFAVLLLAGLSFACGGGSNSSTRPGTTSAASTVPGVPTALVATAANQ